MADVKHKNTSEMKSTHPQLHKTSNIIEKLHLSEPSESSYQESVYFQEKNDFFDFISPGSVSAPSS